MKGKAPKADTIQQILPQLRDPETLRPFPSVQTLIYEGHIGIEVSRTVLKFLGKVRSISIDPTGQWLLSGILFM